MTGPVRVTAKGILFDMDGVLISSIGAAVRCWKRWAKRYCVPNAEEFGEHQYGRVDMHIDEAVKQSAIARAGALKAGADFAGMKVLRVETLDGIKFFLDNPDCAGRKNAAETWLLLRASGTEPLLRVYCESCSTESVAKVLAAAQAFVLEGRAG